MKKCRKWRRQVPLFGDVKFCHKCKKSKDICAFLLNNGKREKICGKCQLDKKQSPQKEQVYIGNGNCYISRLEILRQLGFSDYKSYLSSGLWAIIRKKVFARKGNTCYLCGGKATHLHHRRYCKEELLGKSIKNIVPICQNCHEEIELSGNDKNSMGQVKLKYDKIRHEKLALDQEAKEWYNYLEMKPL